MIIIKLMPLSLEINERSFRLRSLFKFNHTLKTMYNTGLRGTKMQW
jgi:hypothetical protein